MPAGTLTHDWTMSSRRAFASRGHGASACEFLHEAGELTPSSA
jgi:hypothetical protein